MFLFQQFECRERVHHKLNLKVFLEISDVVSISKSVLFELNLECQFAH
jgi:hypothetical protein